MATVERIYDDGLSAVYPESLYNFHGIAQGVNRFDEITAAHIEQFWQQGYLVIHQAFSAAEVQAGLDGLMALIGGSSPDFTGIMYEKSAQGIDVEILAAEERQDYVRKFMWFVDHDQRLKDLAHHPQLLGVIKQLIGKTPLLFQDMALLKPPRIGREKPWHQDHAYFNLPLDTPVVGAWIALDEATVENGCMIVNHGSNHDGPVVHFQRRDWQICDDQINNQGAVAVPLKPGGCLLFSSLTQHGTPANQTGARRRAVQFHYKPADAPTTAAEERLAIFGSDGKDVTC